MERLLTVQDHMPKGQGSTVKVLLMTCRALDSGFRTGRGGLGALYIWASGNGGATDDCNADGYANSPLTIAIGRCHISVTGTHC